METAFSVPVVDVILYDWDVKARVRRERITHS